MKIFPKLLATAVLCASAPLLAGEAPVSLQMTVLRVCYVAPNGPVETGAGFIQLGSITEFCNSGGYSIVLDYTPGTMKGATATFAGQSVLLDGSGQAVLLDADYAVSRVSALVIEQAGVESNQGRIQLRMAAR